MPARASTGSRADAPPRVLLVMPDQWPRALLRATLRQAGYDAIGARTIAEAWTHPREDAARGPVGLVLVDQDALGEQRPGALENLLTFHGDAPVVLLAHATREAPTGPWTRVVRRPLSVGEIAADVQSMLPLPAEARRPVDTER